MKKEDNYLAINKKAWNDKTDVHINSEFYNIPAFLEGKSSLNSIELDLLGDVKGKKILHLQCHFGQDTISLSRMGAEVTGVDFSEKAIKTARELTEKTGANARFICSDIYSLQDNLHEEFDIVFTSYGTIGWLPDLEKWAHIISHFLKQEGVFIFAEFHPVVWMFDNDFNKIAYNYFKSDAIIETELGTYADPASVTEYEMITWNHSLSEVLNNLINAGLQINSFKEYDYSPYNCFRNTEALETYKYRIAHLGNNIPMVYSVKATKK
ncbi:bifunctional 2-polyprenyl-6-hydroxyphenol methylase/3-demethylubiquinol 3-O-methyltransferase UbiG [Flavobacterium sp. NRK1]|uniref:class I SAM-dependent methyltransferase n=1 Tax=Flavobacterium sp. NRK1 TaxID=2954929 RepID=UPI002092820D|nr:class I SAM-dependent methyltransferase [Flavobacterium sp. NRK1]MCO6148809.1 class I SAM-dependent methyltransferase [Flavobacterium sp. NRK1]